MLGVMRKHRKAALPDQPASGVCEPCSTPPQRRSGTRRSRWASEHGYRNAQVTVLAPTGTIGFMMDCDTTGIEPDIALIKYKKLVGGGMLKIVNQTVPPGAGQARLRADRECDDIIALPRQERDHRGRPGPEAGAPAGVRLRLQAGQGHALHPLHGPHQDDGRRPAVPLRRHLQDGEHADDATVEDIEKAYVEAWKLGLKAIAIYRDGCKRTPAAQHQRRNAEAAQKRSWRSRPSYRSDAPAPARRAAVHHPQVLDRRPRGLPHRRACTRTARRASCSA